MIAMSSTRVTNVNDGQDGAQGAQGPQGVSVTNVVPEYRLSNSSTELTGSGTGYTWSETKPEVTGSTYLWTRNRNEFSDNSTPHYSRAVCDITTTNVVFNVDQLNNEISSKVEQSDINTAINTYDNNTVSTIRTQVADHTTAIGSITSRVSSVETTTGSLGTRMTAAETQIQQTEDTIDLLASVTTDGQTQTSTVTLTPEMVTAMTNQFVVKDPEGSETIISGGQIHTGAITTDMIATGAITTNTLDARAVTTAKLDTNAIKSTNYSAPTTATEPYSASGTFLDLANGNIYSPNFVVDNTNSAAYFNGQVVADSGSIGGWEISDKQIYSSVTIGNKEHSVFLRKYDDSAIIATTSSYNMTVNYNSNGEFELTPTQDGSGSFSFTYNISDYPTKILYVYDSYSIDRDQRVNLEFYQNGEYSVPVADPVVLKYTTGEQTVGMSSYTQTGGSIRVTIRYTNMVVSDGKYIVKLKITNLNDEEYTIATGTSVSDASLGVTVIGIGQKTATGVVSYPFSVNRRGELFAYNAHINGEVRATSGSFTGTVNATNGSFNGAITAQSGTIGGYTIVQGDTAGTTETTANDGHVYQTGLYVHSSDGTYEYETGIRGSSTDDEDEAFYVRRIAQDGTWDSSTPTFYVKNNGYLYANNANITGAITATSGSFTGNITAQGGTIGGFNITKSDGGCAAKTSANGGHAYPTSLYVHNSDNTYEYETGIKGESSTGTLAFYVTRITKGGNWQIPSNGGTRTDVFKIEHGGKLYCTNADITGKVTATSFSAQYNGNSSNVLATLTATYLSVANSSYSTLIGASGVTANVLSSGGGSVYTRFCRLTANLGFETYNNSAWGSFYGNSVDVAYDGVRQGRFTASAAGNIGLYDVDNSNYVIYSASDFVVHIPHPTALTSVQTYDGYYKPVGSYGTDGRRVAYISARVDGSNYQFRVAGQWGTTGSTYSTKTIWSASTSDIRLKENIEPTRINGLDAVNRMLVRQFDWKNTGIHQKIGFVADELESIDSNLALGGGYDEDGNMDEKQVNTYQLVAYLTKAVQELSAKVDTLETQIKELKGDK